MRTTRTGSFRSPAAAAALDAGIPDPRAQRRLLTYAMLAALAVTAAIVAILLALRTDAVVAEAPGAQAATSGVRDGWQASAGDWKDALVQQEGAAYTGDWKDSVR